MPSRWVIGVTSHCRVLTGESRGLDEAHAETEIWDYITVYHYEDEYETGTPFYRITPEMPSHQTLPYARLVGSLPSAGTPAIEYW